MFVLLFLLQRFVARYSGSICIHEAGEYRFWLMSDDGVRLYVGGVFVVTIDGLHSMIGAEVSVRLARGFHDVYVEYFQNDGAAGLLLEWIRPGRDTFEVVPRRACYP